MRCVTSYCAANMFISVWGMLILYRHLLGVTLGCMIMYSTNYNDVHRTELKSTRLQHFDDISCGRAQWEGRPFVEIFRVWFHSGRSFRDRNKCKIVNANRYSYKPPDSRIHKRSFSEDARSLHDQEAWRKSKSQCPTCGLKMLSQKVTLLDCLSHIAVMVTSVRGS